MKEGRTLQEVAIELNRQRETMRDFKAPTNKMSYNGVNFAFENTEHSFGTTELFVRQLSSWSDIPKKYVDRLRAEAPELLATNVNHWLSSSEETRLVRTMDGNARAFLSHRYRIIDNIGVVEAALPVLADYGVDNVSQEITGERLYIKAVNKRKTIEVRKGDPVQFGLVISNSEVGLGAVHVDPLILRLVCLNGAVVADAGLRKFHIGRINQGLDEATEVFKDDTIIADDKAFFLKLRDTITAALDETVMADLVESVRAGTVRKIGQAKKLEVVVDVTSRKYGLNQLEQDSVLRQLIDAGDLTQWGLANAVTSVANNTKGYERATELERAGGSLMTLDETEFQEIAA